MNRIFILMISLFLMLSFAPAVFAQNEVLPAKESLPELPSPGQKPGDFFYFLDQWAEELREFLTFNPEAKALLQTERVLERIAEVKALLEVKGVNAPGLAVAQEKIQANMAKAAQIVEKQKAEGKEVAQLAQKLDDDFDVRQELLKQTFKIEKAKLKVKKEEVKLQILQARQAGNFDRVSQLRATLTEIEIQKDNLEENLEVQEELLGLEEEKIEANLEAKEKELEELEEQEEDIIEEEEEELERVFEQREKALELQEKSLEIDFKKAILAGDAAAAEQIQSQLLDVEVQKKTLGEEEEIAEKKLETDKKKLERIRNIKDRAEDQINDARDEIFDVKKEMMEFVALPQAVSELVSEAEGKLAAAELAFAGENYGEAYGQAMAAEMLAKNAEKKIEQTEDLEGKFEELEEE